MKCMDVVISVLAKLRKYEDQFVCKEKTEDIYCMRMVVLDEIRRHHEEQMESVAKTPKDAHNAVGVERETGQDKVAGEQEELHRGCAANEMVPGTKNQSARECHSEEVATSVTTVPRAARVATELEGEQGRAYAKHKEHCCASAT